VLATKNDEIIAMWRRLQTSDHFYYMCIKWFQDGDVHKYFSPYQSPYDAFLFFSNALHQVRFLSQKTLQNLKPERVGAQAKPKVRAEAKTKTKTKTKQKDQSVSP
jgi:alpha-amylase